MIKIYKPIRAVVFTIAVIYLVVGTLFLDPIVIGCALAIFLILRSSDRQRVYTEQEAINESWRIARALAAKYRKKQGRDEPL